MVTNYISKPSSHVHVYYICDLGKKNWKLRAMKCLALQTFLRHRAFLAVAGPQSLLLKVGWLDARAATRNLPCD